ncbi:MAG: hypothetical protein LH632_17900, partial [Rhodoferax sp.]|nr:hypothetical protein [Rhodoferax sp.]
MDTNVSSALDYAPRPTAPGGAEVLKPLRWNNRFARLDPTFFTRLTPTALPQPYWVGTNPALAAELGLDDTWLSSP